MKLLFALLLAAVSLAAAAETPKIKLTVEISTAGDHLRAHFHAAQPVAEIRLQASTSAELERDWTAIRQRQWRPVGTAWREIGPDGAIARRDRVPFQDADLDLFPDDKRQSWIKPGIFRLGAGFVISNRYLLADPLRFDPTLIFRPRENEITEFGETSQMGDARLVMRDYRRAVYFGPKALVRQIEGVRVIAPPDAPAWMTARLAHTISRSAAFFQEKIGLRSPDKFTLMLGLLDDGKAGAREGYIGKPEYGSALTLRFYGRVYRNDWRGPQAALDKAAAHEIFHFWDGLDFYAHGPGSGWLEEGAAVYASIRVRRMLGLMAESDERRELDRAVAACREGLGQRGLADEQGYSRYQEVYPCGALVHWIADVAIWKASGGKRNFFSLWRDLIQEKSFTADHYLSLVRKEAPEANEALAQILDPQPEGRWAALGRRMTAFGIQAGPGAPPTRTIETALVAHLARLDCTGVEKIQAQFGEEESIQLDTSAEACPHLGDKPNIAAVEGFLPRSQVDDAYAAMMAKCAAGGVIDVALDSGKFFGLACNKPLASLPAVTDGFGIRSQ